ncbi:hypothetical protein BDP27DRAFT_1361117 [Rhodocollybia butyracea]|uniref:Uncharacterized protein n=1 Tax=Rhodocollybia butyracea TaxID=206335 RepID=A0A9P5PZU0_9AGAR|nr:hypothetical protein BDP27DRAFT_1361117 [Rhodocollybia butyracea]
MRLNTIFVILGFICTICAIPLPASPADSNALKVPADKFPLPLDSTHSPRIHEEDILYITIQFLEVQPEETREEVEKKVKLMVKTAVLKGVDYYDSRDQTKHKLSSFDPYNKITLSTKRKYIVHHAKSPKPAHTQELRFNSPGPLPSSCLIGPDTVILERVGYRWATMWETGGF